MARRPPHSRETIERIRAAQINYWSDPQVRAAHGELTRRRMMRPEVRTRISLRTKEALADPITRERQRSAIAKAMASPAVRARISRRTREALRELASGQ